MTDELEGQRGTPGVVPLASAAIMEDILNVAGRIEDGAAKSPYRSSAFVPGQVETVDMVLTGVAATSDVDRELGFPAHSVIVDNPTKQWIFVSSAQRFCPPGVLGYVMQIPKASTKAQIRWRTPDGLAQPAIGTAVTVSLTFCEAWLMPCPGTAIGVGV